MTKINLLTGGHPYEREPFLDMFRDADGLEMTEFTHPDVEPAFTEPCETLVFFDHGTEISNAARQAFEQRLEEGVGCVFLHHCLYNYPNWLEFPRILGGFWSFTETRVGNDRCGPSTWSDDELIPVHIEDRDHPVTRELEDFTITDETYGNYWIAADVTPLLTTTHPASERVIGWTHTYGASRIVYLQPGDKPPCYAHPSYRQLIRNAIDYVAL